MAQDESVLLVSFLHRDFSPDVELILNSVAGI